MSMHICNKSLPTRIAEYDRQFVVDNQQHESLAAFVGRVRNEKEFSLSKVEKNAGGEIDSSYISRVENGHVRNVSPEKLKALAKGLQISEDELFAVARGQSLEPMTPHDFITALEALGVEQFSAYGGLEKLSREDQQEIIAMVEAMVEQKLKRKRK